MSTTAVERPPAFIPVAVSSIAPVAVSDVSFYLREAAGTVPRLYRGGEYPLTEQDLRQLAARGVRTLFIAAEDHERYQQYLRASLEDSLRDESVPVERRFGQLNLVVRDLLRAQFRERNVDRTVEAARGLAESAVALLNRDGLGARELCRVLCHDYQTFTHCANVSYYCVLLARGLGISSAGDLREIAAGGLLHDLGKLDVPESILNKPGKLDDREFDIIRRHPTFGFRLLAGRDDLSIGQLMMVYQHHERGDGRGYPVGLTAEGTHPWGRICAVADVFEALTSDRPYRRGMPVAEALRIMERDARTGLDSEAFQCWKALINSNS